ncbi:hypothetical protein D3C78_611550 [compost metagenome]
MRQRGLWQVKARSSAITKLWITLIMQVMTVWLGTLTTIVRTMCMNTITAEITMAVGTYR